MEVNGENLSTLLGSQQSVFVQREQGRVTRPDNVSFVQTFAGGGPRPQLLFFQCSGLSVKPST